MPKFKLSLAAALLSALALPRGWADTDATILKHISIYETRDAHCANPATHPPHPNRKKPGTLGTIWELPTSN